MPCSYTHLHKTFRKVTLEEPSLGNGHGTEPEVQGVFGRCSQTCMDPGVGLKDPCGSLLTEDVLWFCGYRTPIPTPDPRVENSKAQLFRGKHPTRLIFLLQILSCSNRETANRGSSLEGGRFLLYQLKTKQNIPQTLQNCQLKTIPSQHLPSSAPKAK